MIFNTQNALAVTSVLLAATSVAADGFRVVPRGSNPSLVGCYSAIPGYGSSKSWTYQSSGWCSDRCFGMNQGAFALTGGSNCICGSTLPPSSDKVSSDKCNTPCSGWPEDMCGGSSYYSIYTSGYEPDVPTYSDSDSSSTTTTGGSTTTQTNANTAVSTAASGQTTIVTSESQATPTAETSEEKKASSSHNTAAIAAGVVVGVVGFAALCGAGFFWWRSKNNKANAARGAPAGGYGRDSNPPSMSDSRFDGDYMAQRRQSNGSIDDDHDFSRRILQVTNPDR